MAELDHDDAAATLAVTRRPDAHGGVSYKVSGQLDVSTASALRDALQPALADGEADLVLDVSELDFMDSSGLAVLLGAAQQVSSLQLRNPTRIVRRVITIAGLVEILPMTPDD